jgi:hypothetical protein
MRSKEQHQDQHTDQAKAPEKIRQHQSFLVLDDFTASRLPAAV